MSFISILHIIVIALLVLPNTMYFASVNILSEGLSQHFNSSNLHSLSYTLISAPSIISAITFSLILDAFKFNIIFPIIQSILILGTAFNIVSIKVTNQYLFLFGRFLYGVCGETTLAAQSQLIDQFLPQKLHSTAFAVCFCGYMAGEALAGLILPKLDLINGYIVILSFQTLSLALILIYSIKSKTIEKANFKILLKDLLAKLTKIPAVYFILACFRILFTASKSTYDSRSIIALKTIYNIPLEISQQAQIVQTSLSAVVFLISGISGFFKFGPEIFVILGALFCCFGYIFCYFSIPNQFLISTLIGFGFGMVAANCSALLVKRAGGGLASSALGVVFSLQYLLSTGIIPLSRELSKIDEKDNMIMYLILVILGFIVWSGEMIIYKLQKRIPPTNLVTEGDGIEVSAVDQGLIYENHDTVNWI
ncbi:Major facilitator superfamily protein [Spironucleus salmonicida]|nr:Major facilitator superfamily protein [Spironucleus salmonicida]